MIEIKADELIMKYATNKCSIMELGNQIMNLEKVQNISGKEYYGAKGYYHTSIDQNGRDGALPLNLSEPIGYEIQYDVVTDMGTTEHVSDLYNCLLNVFNFCKEGGIMIHKNPKTGNFPKHGFHFFTIDFWTKYAKLCKLDVIELFEYPIYHNTTDGWEVIAVLKKTKDSLPITTSKFETLTNYYFQS